MPLLSVAYLWDVQTWRKVQGLSFVSVISLLFFFFFNKQRDSFSWDKLGQSFRWTHSFQWRRLYVFNKGKQEVTEEGHQEEGVSPIRFLWFRVMSEPQTATNFHSIMEHNTSQRWDAWLAYVRVITEFVWKVQLLISYTVYRKWMTNYLYNSWPASVNLMLWCMKFNSPASSQSLKNCLYLCISERTDTKEEGVVNSLKECNEQNVLKL